MATVEESIKDITARLLKIDPSNITPEAQLGAESLQSVELVAMFEEEFGIDMDEDEALSVSAVGGATEFITRVCQEQGVEA